MKDVAACLQSWSVLRCKVFLKVLLQRSKSSAAYAGRSLTSAGHTSSAAPPIAAMLACKPHAFSQAVWVLPAQRELASTVHAIMNV